MGRVRKVMVPTGYLTDGMRLFYVEQFTAEYVVLTDCYTERSRAVPLREFSAMGLVKPELYEREAVAA